MSMLQYNSHYSSLQRHIKITIIIINDLLYLYNSHPGYELHDPWNIFDPQLLSINFGGQLLILDLTVINAEMFFLLLNIFVETVMQDSLINRELKRSLKDHSKSLC